MIIWFLLPRNYRLLFAVALSQDFFKVTETTSSADQESLKEEQKYNTHIHKHRHTYTILRRVVTQAMTFILKHHVCAVDVEQLVRVHRHKDAPDVGLCDRARGKRRRQTVEGGI